MSGRRARRSHSPASDGFTLFEVVIALAIAALGLGLLMAAASTGVGNSALARQYIEATRRAQSHLAEIGIIAPIVPGVQSGDDDDGYTWQAQISPPLLHAGPPVTGTKPFALYRVDVSVSWRSGNQLKTVSLQSQRIAAP